MYGLPPELLVKITYDRFVLWALLELQLDLIMHDDFCWTRPEFQRFPFAPDSRGQH